MLIFHYKSKKCLRDAIGEPLSYEETSLFGAEFRRDGDLTGSNRPTVTRIPGAREFFARVTMKNGLIHKVD